MQVSSIKNYYLSLDNRSKAGLLVGIAVIVLGTAFALWWIFSSRQQLLFGDLRQSDAAEIVQSLDEWKVPHTFTEDGGGILVDEKLVHETRMRLVSAGVPRGGHVGFELFDNDDFGVTEFAQRINYQRALQGEIERTIAVMPGVEDVRVHLAIKRPGLFLAREEESKASVALTLAPGASLSGKQVGGIKNLVAAAVEGLSSEAVVVIGPGGMQLAGSVSEAGQDVSGQQEQSDQIAARLERRVADLLANALGNKDSAVSVDVRLNFDRVHKTSERLLAQPGSEHGLITKRQTGGMRPQEPGAPTGLPDEQVEYAHGTEREEITMASGAIERLSVAVLLPAPTTGPEIDRLRLLVGAAVGLDTARGDHLEMAVAPAALSQPLKKGLEADESPAAGTHVDKDLRLKRIGLPVWIGVAAIAGMLIGLLLAKLLRRPSRSMNEQDSEALAAQIRVWLNGEQATP